MGRSLLAAALAALLGSCGGSEKAPSGPSGADDDDDEGITLGDRERGKAPGLVPTDDEDDDGSGLEVKGLRGRLESHQIHDGVSPHEGALSSCYSDNLNRRRYLGGDITFRFTVKTSGEVKSVQIEKSDLGAWAVERCMLAVARRMTFAKPSGGEADFTLPLEFDATRSVSWLDEEVGLAQVKEPSAQLKECAAASSTRTPSDVMITLYVGSRGQVTSVGFASAAKDPIDDDWADCADAMILAWVLSDPLGKIAKIAFKWN